MGVTVRSVKVKLGLDVSEFNRNALGAAASLKAIPDGAAASAVKARTELSSLERELQKIAATRYDATVVLEDTDAAARLDALNARLDRFGASVSDARVGVDDRDAVAKISGIEAALIGLSQATASPNIDLRGVAKAEAELAMLEVQLKSIGGNGGGRGGLGGFIDGLDDSNNRMSNLIQYAVALGPALIPVLGGAALGATALGTSLTVAAAAAGVTALALAGVGDALTALNTYQLNPTQASMDALRTKLEALGPAGQNFVFFLQSLRPKLEQLQTTAQNGFLPGLTDGINQVMHSFPIVNSLVGDLASTMGDLASEAGHALESPFWQGFLADFAANASAELATFSEGVGNVATGLAGLFQAFLPASSDFNSELLKMSQEFSQWGQNLSGSQGFQDFISYIETNGPNAAAALGAVAQALIGIVKAGAPVGAIVLPIITDLAKGFAAVANSPAGPVLFSTAAALSALGRSVALLKALNITAAITSINSLGTAEGVGGVNRLTTGLGRLTAQITPVRALGAGVGLLALSLTDLDDKAGVSNTLTGAALGSIAGPWGAAIGGAIGLTKDLASANDDLEQSMSNVASTFDSQTGNLKDDTNALKQLSDQYTAYKSKLDSANKGLSDPLAPFKNPLSFFGDLVTVGSDKLTGSADEGADALAKETAALAALKSGWTAFAHDTGGNKADIASIADVLTNKLGYSIQYINNLLEKRKTGFSADDALLWTQLTRQVQDYQASLDSVPGRTKAVRDALADLDNPLESTAQSAQTLADAMDALFGPALSLSAATDQWAQDLADLKKNLDDNNKSLNGQTNAARNNRGLIRGLVTDLQAVAKAGADTGESAGEFAARLQGMYTNLIKTGVAAGLNRKQFMGYLATLNLTPHEIKVIVKQFGVQEAEKQTKDLVDAYNALPAELRTDIMTNGWPTTMAQVKALQRQYHLTPAQVKTLMQAIDHATGPIDSVKAKIADLDGDTATTYINVVTTQTQINKVLNQLGSGQGTAQADGSVLDFYRNGGLRENHVAQIAPAGSYRIWGEPETGGEAYIPLAPQKRARSRSIADETVSRLGGAVQWMADGGIGIRGSGGYSSTTGQLFTPEQLAGAVAAALNGSELTLADRNGALVGMIHTGARTVVDSAAAFTEQQRRAKPPTR